MAQSVDQWIITQTGINLENSNQIQLIESDHLWCVIPEENEMEAATINEYGFRVTRVVSLYDPEITNELTEFIGPPEDIQSEEQEPVSSCVASVQQAEVNEMEAETINEHGFRVTRIVSLYDPEITNELTEFIGPPKDIQSEEEDSVSSCVQSVQRELTEITEPSNQRCESSTIGSTSIFETPSCSKRTINSMCTSFMSSRQKTYSRSKSKFFSCQSSSCRAQSKFNIFL